MYGSNLRNEIHRAHITIFGGKANTLLLTEIGPPPAGQESPVACEYVTSWHNPLYNPALIRFLKTGDLPSGDRFVIFTNELNAWIGEESKTWQEKVAVVRVCRMAAVVAVWSKLQTVSPETKLTHIDMFGCLPFGFDLPGRPEHLPLYTAIEMAIENELWQFRHNPPIGPRKVDQLVEAKILSRLALHCATDAKYLDFLKLCAQTALSKRIVA